MPTRLDNIIAATRRRVAETRRTMDVGQLERQAELHVPRGFRLNLQKTSESGIAVIAELKKASPSRGLIRPDFDVMGLAKELERAGAAALSVLTDEEFFQGSLENLRLASGNTSLPCLRKDFIVDELQILEARARCADAVLLIVAALSQAELVSLAGRASELGLDVLCETHDEDELTRALDAGCDLIGVNSRDLRTFNVDLRTALKLAARIPSSVVSVAESGINNAADISNLRAAGYNACLIGESLMKAESPGQALSNLLSGVKVASF
jgi:indole-3-glycerol phosphate synthase